MMAQFRIVNFIIFLTSLCIPATFAEFVETVTTTITHGDENIVLNLRLSQRFLANHNLPIWTALKDRPPSLAHGVMERVGRFAFYQNTSQAAALVFTENSQSFFGFIDTRFYIDNLPLSLARADLHHDVNGPYVKFRGHNGRFHDDINFPTMHPPDMNLQNLHGIVDNFPNPDCLFPETQSSSNHGPSDMHPTVSFQAGPNDYHHNQHDFPVLPPLRRDVLYVEILIFVTNDIVQYYHRPGYSVVSLVAFYLIQFNAIDMLYAKLEEDGILIHINIAGLLLENERFAFPCVFMTNQPQQYENLNTAQTLMQIYEYLKSHRTQFTEDSFDFFFLSTNYNLHNQDGNRLIGGANVLKTGYGSWIIHEAMRGILGVIIQRASTLDDFVAGTHELAHLMSITHDDPPAVCIDGQRCLGIMQTVGSYCKFCMKWSAKSVLEFNSYVSTNTGRCFLLNHPRSLYPYGTRMNTIGPARQCSCYGYESQWQYPFHNFDAVHPNSCNQALTCTIDDEAAGHQLPRPRDGTPCDYNKVCWNGECLFAHI